jgi:hypothetical protein
MRSWRRARGRVLSGVSAQRVPACGQAHRAVSGRGPISEGHAVVTFTHDGRDFQVDDVGVITGKSTMRGMFAVYEDRSPVPPHGRKRKSNWHRLLQFVVSDGLGVDDETLVGLATAAIQGSTSTPDAPVAAVPQRGQRFEHRYYATAEGTPELCRITSVHGGIVRYRLETDGLVDQGPLVGFEQAAVLRWIPRPEPAAPPHRRRVLSSEAQILRQAAEVLASAGHEALAAQVRTVAAQHVPRPGAVSPARPSPS